MERESRPERTGKRPACAEFSADRGAERVADRQLHLSLGKERGTAEELLAAEGAAHHLQPLEREAPVRIDIEDVCRSPRMPALCAVAVRADGVDDEPVVARTQRAASEALGQQRIFRAERPARKTARDVVRGGGGLTIQPLRDRGPAVIGFDVHSGAVEARVLGVVLIRRLIELGGGAVIVMQRAQHHAIEVAHLKPSVDALAMIELQERLRAAQWLVPKLADTAEQRSLAVGE